MDSVAGALNSTAWKYISLSWLHNSFHLSIYATGAVYRGDGECVMAEMKMYQRTSRAAVWSGAAENQARSTTDDSTRRGAPERTIWAKVPFQSRRGRCVAVRCRGDQLWVGVAGSPAILWLPVRQALTDDEVAAWLAFGFLR